MKDENVQTYAATVLNSDNSPSIKKPDAINRNNTAYKKRKNMYR